MTTLLPDPQPEEHPLFASLLAPSSHGNFMPRRRKDRHSGSFASEDHGEAGDRPVQHGRGDAQLGRARKPGGFRFRRSSPLPVVDG